MSKRHQIKKNDKQKLSVVAGIPPAKEALSTTDKIIHFISNKKMQLLLIVALALAFYGNSVNNDFATDDNEYYFNNQFVQKGVGGIYDLVTKESLYGYYAHASIVSGGRWRPLSLITFALEKEFFNANPQVSHFINTLVLVLTGIIMLLFLRKYLFIASPIAAFIVTLLFIIHPVHTEAVSHIKSRDELLSWLFLLLTLYYSLNFLTKRNYWQLVLSLVFYSLALLSKENGMTFIVILPLTFYFFTKNKLSTIVFVTLPFAVVLGSYLLIRSSIVSVMTNASTDIMNAPYTLATPVQHLATTTMLLGKYLLLLFWPNPLSCDYSYNSVPYVDFSDWRAWLSAFIQAAFVIYALLKLKEKRIVSYGILFYFCSIFIVSNLIIDVGTFVGERFLYQPSFGFCLAIVVAANELLQKIKFKNAGQKFSVISALITGIVLLNGFQTITRNADWKNSSTLWSADVKKEPNSILLHESLGNIYMNDALQSLTPKQCQDNFAKALAEDDTAIYIFPKYPITWFNLGYLYLLMHNNKEAEKAFINCVQSDSTYAQGYNGLGSICYQNKNYEQALRYYEKGAQLDSTDAQFFYNIGLCYRGLNQDEQAILYFKKTLALLANLQNVIENKVTPQMVEQNLLGTEYRLKTKKQQ